MRTALLCLLIPAAALAEAPRDKFTLPKSQLEAVLNKERDAKVAKVQAEVQSLERDIAESQPPKAKRGQKFEPALSKSDLAKAKAKLKELQSEIAKLKAQKPVIPEIEFATLIPAINDRRRTTDFGFTVCRLVELKSNTAGGNPAIPLFVTIEKLSGDNRLQARHGSGQRIDIEADTSLYSVGQVITLDMPITCVRHAVGARDSSIDIQLFEN